MHHLCKITNFIPIPLSDLRFRMETHFAQAHGQKVVFTLSLVHPHYYNAFKEHLDLPILEYSCSPGLAGEKNMVHSAFKSSVNQSKGSDANDNTNGRNDIDKPGKSRGCD